MKGIQVVNREIKKQNCPCLHMTCCLCRKSQRIDEIKTLRNNKWVYQSLRIQNQHTKINLNLHINNKYVATEVENIIPFIITPKKIKYLGIKSNKT